MRVDIKDNVINKVKSLVNGNKISRLEVYSDDKKKELIDRYIGANLERFIDYKIVVEEYEDGMSVLTIEGSRYDKSGNIEKYEGYDLIKHNQNVLGYSSTDSNISFVQMINPDISSNNMLYGKDMIDRERFNLYLGGKKRFYLETFKDASSNKVIYERYHDFSKEEIKKVNIYYDVLECPIYGMINDEVQPQIVDKNINYLRDIIFNTNESLDQELVIKK